MKNLFTLLLALCFSFNCVAQNDIILKINHKFGADDFELDKVVTSYEGYDLKISRLQYYLSAFKITHDGGQETPAPQHFLINGEDVIDLNLGTFDITDIESITFSVGVDEARNHLDPSTFPSTHPLAPQNPSMHWGWTAGYRFVALEGKAGANVSTTYQVHALGDANYQTLTIPVQGNINNNTLTINLDADCLGMFNEINVSSGVVTHGDFDEAVTLLENFATHVFFPQGEIPVKTIDPTFEGKFQIQPNPSFDKSTNVILNLPSANNYQLTLTDLTGRVIQNQKIDPKEQTIEISSSHAGVYFIHLWKNGEPVAYEKWILK